MRKAAKSLAVILALVMIAGCGKVESQSAKLPLVNDLSANELAEMKKKDLEYDAVVQRNIEVHETKYELYDVDNYTLEKLIALQNEVNQVLGYRDFPKEKSSEDDVISEELFNYIKTVVDDKILYDGKAISYKRALGYYFVDTEYKVKAAKPGTFTDKAIYIGLDGAFDRDYLGKDSISRAYMLNAVNTLNRYYAENRIDKKAAFDERDYSFNMTGTGIKVIGDRVDASKIVNKLFDESKPEETTSAEDSSSTESTPQTESSTDENKTEASSEPTSIQTSGETKNVGTLKVKNIVNRQPLIDIEEFNSIVGSSLTNVAYIPDLDIIYSKTEPEGNLSGYCLYPCGAFTLAEYAGYDRNSMEGTMVIRTVMKDDTSGKKDIVVTNMYPVRFQLDKGISSEFSETVPEFVWEKLEQAVERADRAIVNNDLAALMNRKIYSDMGKAILVGFQRENTNVLKNMSVLRRVLSRPKDINENYSNTYIVEIETYRQEGAKGTGGMNTYIDLDYACIQQKGTDFVVTDYLTVSRDMAREADINVDNGMIKKLIALNLAGNVPEESRKEIVRFLSDLDDACCARQKSHLNEAKVVTIKGTQKNLLVGIDDCFNNDVDILSTNDRNYMESALLSELIKLGSSIKSTKDISITQFIGGNNRQVEFTTEEIVQYIGHNRGYYSQNYYLVSKTSDKWTIDERKEIEGRLVEGDEYATLGNRVLAAKSAQSK